MKNNKQHIIFFSFIFLFFFFNNANLNGYSGEGNSRILPIEIVGPVTILILLIYIYLNKIRNFIPKEITSSLNLFFICLFLISLFRQDILASIRNFIAILITYTVVICMTLILHKLPLSKSINILIYLVCFIILPFNFYIQQVKQGGFALMPERAGDDDVLRFGGALYHAHNGMVLGFTLLLLIILIYTFKKRTLLNYILLLFLIISIILTDCRSVWGGITLCLILFFYSSIKSKSNRTIFVTGALFALTLGYIYTSTKKNTYSNTNQDAAFREIIWISGLNGVLKSPIIGYGTENYFQKNVSARKNISDNLADPHNSFLDLFLMNGIIVSILLIILYFKIFKWHKRLNVMPYLYVLFVFWLFVPFFWGHIYKGTTGFIQFYFPLTIFGVILHPDLSKIAMRKAQSIKKINPKVN